jgi:hypothetical protein
MSNLQSEPWMLGRATLKSRQKNFIYDVESVAELEIFQRMCRRLNVHPDELLFGFEIALRYLSYGHLAGEGNYYLSHPFRELQNFPGVAKEPVKSVEVPVRIGPHIASMIDDLSLDEYTVLLHEARGLVREMNIIGLKPGIVEEERLREFAFRLGLPARLKQHPKVIGALSAFVAGIGVVPILGQYAALLGSMIAVASTFWSGGLPRGIARASWLQWALEWDIEKKTMQQ